ncbi:UDP-N-acetylmuramoyl-L-alanine--D-glutamate ligase [Corynebacterium pelargi]|uniref:UDP-N-acetylmuramoylalanine--D-glutamate ligase n=1 Tax=Corynebacterium pelargi TaxID=1471400 RepID=A0A410W7W9_9CORY|nr:UDP-N-acetylmuramoyl-L-alanine--D-glutamate ligase [Corynebacterium pelargi]QAU52038.1 UDP-N-acetylmuramoylalanine--D-glutamate ligase [Corynebacterium pelargi]GGG70594.1 UDP-N-acetylmuramoyl-L-alanyl-D-glutamate synthetase [Corynebacterium pelargi]
MASTLLDGKIVVAGAGISGIGTARLLQSLDAQFELVDASAAALERAEGIPTALIGSDTLDGVALVVTSPGWRPDSPLLVEAQQRGIPVIGDVELAYRLDRDGAFGQPRTWMVVTGTNGKTTTTAMLAAMMQAGGFEAQAVGNIGVSIAEALLGERVDVLVAELSSFQLHWAPTLVPDVGVLLNLADDHIDWHGSFEAYAQAKAKVLAAPVHIAGIEDPAVAELADDRTIGFRLEAPQANELGVRDGMLVSRAFGDSNLVLAQTEGIQPPGPAGIADALAAAAAARSQGVSAEAIASALEGFQVAGHRGQTVENEGGVLAVDNSKATNPHAADAALAGFESIIWIAGGQLKGASVEELVRTHAHRIKAAALLGVDREEIASVLREYAPDAEIMCTASTDPDKAMGEVVGFALSRYEQSDAIVLAPAAASLDMYTSMAQRGDLFAYYIQALTKSAR